DPGRDTPERLADYTSAFSDRMLGLTGTQKQLTSVTRRYRISYGYDEPRADGSYDVSHSSSVLVFGPDLKARLMLLDSLTAAEWPMTSSVCWRPWIEWPELGIFSCLAGAIVV